MKWTSLLHKSISLFIVGTGHVRFRNFLSKSIRCLRCSSLRGLVYIGNCDIVAKLRYSHSHIKFYEDFIIPMLLLKCLDHNIGIVGSIQIVNGLFCKLQQLWWTISICCLPRACHFNKIENSDDFY